MSARLSPAASLLRNSKLFALPPQIALPAAPPSSEQLSSSDTATTVHPQYAAIRTTREANAAGDWGFKRPLPPKTTRHSQAKMEQVVRLVRGIDTPEHIADFESAQDHYLTLRKFQELDLPLALPPDEKAFGNVYTRKESSPFLRTHDNTANLTSTAPVYNEASGVWPHVKPDDVFSRLPESLQRKQKEYDQKKSAASPEHDAPAKNSDDLQKLLQERIVRRRWRYAGPSLAAISGMEFDEYLHKLGAKERHLMIAQVKQRIVAEKRRNAQEKGQANQVFSVEQITEEDLNAYLRYLRNRPQEFGPILANVLDLPEVKPPPEVPRDADLWEYGRVTLASPQWAEKGPPRTHPSAGLSYVQSSTGAVNDPTYGPQKDPKPTVARAVRTRFAQNVGASKQDWGVAGFVVPTPGSMTQSIRAAENVTGPKIPVEASTAFIQSDGTLKMHVKRKDGHQVIDDRAVLSTEVEARDAAMYNMTPSATPRMGNLSSSPGLATSHPGNARPPRTPQSEASQNEAMEAFFNRAIATRKVT